ncbi:MAG: tRNA (adenosine(37)-N6)-dimethylallyltransferase MiaA [Bacteroidales bacterium]|nr:tRNA (adenosine(37)-N6)-dimethylallyltransferase MiaA [Bacteroidales bacterium]
MKKTLVVLAGPTAVGKTSCGIGLARHFGTEIISADSRQIYRETTIGTAVPSPEEQALVKHHFVQMVSVKERYNASIYENQVLARLEILFQKHDLVLMVGGSGLYIDAVCEGIDELPQADLLLRKELRERLEQEGLEALTGQLQTLDPASYEKLDLKNPMRVLKALEVSIQTGLPYSSFLSATRKDRPFRILRVALDMDREKLYMRINRRVDLMMKAGLLEEARHLHHLKGYSAMKTVGYRELFRVLEGELSLNEGVDLIKRNTRKFARKQLTWLRKENRYQWFHPGPGNAIIAWIESELATCKNSG